jgi:hypothetical protein
MKRAMQFLAVLAVANLVAFAGVAFVLWAVDWFDVWAWNASSRAFLLYLEVCICGFAALIAWRPE